MRLLTRVFALAVVGAVSFSQLSAQDRLARMPGVDQYRKIQPLMGGALVSGSIAPVWADDSKAFTFFIENLVMRPERLKGA